VTLGHVAGRGGEEAHRSLDLVPDFLVFETALDNDGTKTNKPVLAGFFDGEWKLDPATTWWYEKN
jgi:hypothetical protein